MPVEMLPFLAIWTFLRARIDEARDDGDRGDISISTVIIWVAVIAGAVLIAAALTALFTKYKGKVSGL
ncbi:MAG: hypothetical protein JO362_01725 [Streptomycetaceae bacterium]|nr:hypothetical protein [Streptomycetaceae bacterium]